MGLTEDVLHKQGMKNNSKNVPRLHCFEKRKWDFRFQFRMFSAWGIVLILHTATGVMFCTDKSLVKNVTSLGYIWIT